MNRSRSATRWTRGPALALAGALALAACDDTGIPTSADPPVAEDLPAELHAARTHAQGNTMRILTRNAYLGGDTGPLFDPAVLSDPMALIQAVNVFWGQVQANDFAARAQAIAEEIDRTDPHVVALQEMATYVAADAVQGLLGRLDMAAVLQGALADRGLDYRLAVRQVNTELQLPLVFTPGVGLTGALNATLGEVTLVRGDVSLRDAESGRYQAAVPVPVPGGEVLSIGRGWSRVTVQYRGQPWTVVNTHLETQGIRPVHDAQAAELIQAVLPGLKGTTILVGDLNSDAEGVEGDPSWTPTYGLLLAAGFRDLWTRVADTKGPGFTCCHEPDLSDPSTTLDERIDFVLVRRDNTERSATDVGVSFMTVLGDELDERTATNPARWPADHAGLFAGLYYPDPVTD